MGRGPHRRPLMAKKRSNRGFVPIEFETSITLGALANDAHVNAVPVTFGEDLFVISADIFWTLRNHTAAEGPVECGLAHSDLSGTEVVEALDASLTDPDDIIAKERNRRPVKRAVQFAGLQTDEVPNDGKAIRTKFRRSIGDGFGLSLWVVNRSNGTLTTGTIVEVRGTIYGRWQR